MKYHIESITKEELLGKMKFEKFYDTQEVATILKKSSEQARRYIREGKIQAYKEWKNYYILESDLREYMIQDDRVKIEIMNFINFEYEHQVKFYNRTNDGEFKGAIRVLISMLNDFAIPLRDSIIEELRSMFI